MRRAPKVLLFCVAAVVALCGLLGAGLYLAGRTDAGRDGIARLTARLTGGMVTISGLHGDWPTQLLVDHLELRDRDGVWLSADRIELTWHPLALLRDHVTVDTLRVATITMARLPVSAAKPGSRRPSIPVIEVAQWSADLVQLGPALAGRAASLSAQGRVTLHSIDDEIIVADLRRLDGDGRYGVDLRFDSRRLDAALQLHEPAGGPLENILQLPGLGELSATLGLHGPREAAVLALQLTAGGLRAQAGGTLDVAAGAVDLGFALHATAMQPRTDLAWRRLDLDGHWHGDLRTPVADGKLEVQQLLLPGGTALPSLAAELRAADGGLKVHAVGTGLRIPGPRPDLLAADPVTLDAAIRLNEAGRPFELRAGQRLFDLQANGNAAAPQRAALELRWHELMALARLADIDLGGSLLVKADITARADGAAVNVEATASLAGGAPTLVNVLGARPSLQLQGAVRADAIDLAHARLAGAAGFLSLSDASLALAPAGAGAGTGTGPVSARWELHLEDLGRLSTALAGHLDADGSLAGPLRSLSVDAKTAALVAVRGSPSGRLAASLHLRGIPSAPAGELQADGMLDGGPLQIDVGAERRIRGAWGIVIHKGDWKSAHAEGDATVGTAAGGSAGRLHLRIGDLADVGHLVGAGLHGAVDADLSLAQQDGATVASVGVAAKGISLGAIAGDLELSGKGTANALHVDVSARLPDLRGAPADLKAAGDVNLEAAQLQLREAALNYRAATVTLGSPATFTFKDGLTVDRLSLAAGRTVFELQGRFAPSLDLQGELRGLDAQLVGVFLPDLLSTATIGAQAQLRGSWSEPEGRVQLDATGVRFRDDSASGLPALALHATADLEGDTARLDARLSAGTGSLLNVAGDVPLDVDGAADLSVDGAVDLALASPLLEARGQQIAGRMRVDMHLAGTTAAPQLAGTLGITQGQWRDYSRGIGVTSIAADINGTGGALVIKSFEGHAASGEVHLSGTFGLLQPGMPVDLRLKAKDAEPIASSLVTATLDADVAIKGTLREHVDVSGDVLLHRTVIGIPNGLPPNVAVLDVRRRGQAPAPPDRRLVVGLDLNLRAPQEMLVQGRGLDAELGGEIHLGGTTDEPQVSGGFDLQRGSFSLAGNKLTFTAGRVGFEGSGLQKKIDPSLDFTASTALAASTITLRVTGPADSPQFEFSSSPPQPQDEIMAHLFFGEDAAQLTALQAAQIGAALATLSGITGDSLNPLVKLQRTLGLDRLSLSSAAGAATTAGGSSAAGASVAAGRYLTKRVYVEAKQSTTGSTQVQVDVDITKHLKVQTRLGNGTAIAQGTTPDNDPGSSVGLSYQFEY